jgi:hypothetical protein
MKFQTGKQYPGDAVADPSGFLARARLHQSRFRANTLELPCDGFGNYLTREDAEKGLNFYNGFGIFEAVRAYRNYNKPLYANMLRSKHIPFNLFVPLAKDKDYFRKVISDILRSDILSVECIKIEYAPYPRKKYLNDATSFDTYIEYTNAANEKGIIGIEVKYTEREYKRREKSKEADFVDSADSRYWTVTRKIRLFKPESLNKLKEDTFRQVWRNHILGESILQEDGDKYKHFTSLTLFPEGNIHFVRTSREYLDFLTKNENNFIPLMYESFFAILDIHCPDDVYQKWINYLKTRYIVPKE